MDLWERGLYAVLVGDTKAEGAAREGRAARIREEEDEAVARSYHDTVLSGKIRPSVRWSSKRKRVGCLLPDGQCTKTGQLVAEVLREKYPDMHVPPCGKLRVRSL